MTVLAARAEAGVGEAPRHEVAGLGHGGAARYGFLRRALLIIEWPFGQQMHAASVCMAQSRRFSAVVVRV